MLVFLPRVSWLPAITPLNFLCKFLDIVVLRPLLFIPRLVLILESSVLSLGLRGCPCFVRLSRIMALCHRDSRSLALVGCKYILLCALCVLVGIANASFAVRRSFYARCYAPNEPIYLPLSLIIPTVINLITFYKRKFIKPQAVTPENFLIMFLANYPNSIQK